MTQLGSLDEAAAYIKKLKERVDELQQKRRSAQLLASTRGGGIGASASVAAVATMSRDDAGSSEEAAVIAEDEAVAPVVEVRHHPDGSSLDVVLISSVVRPFKMHEVVTVLEEEGAEIINTNFSVAGQKNFYTIHSRVHSFILFFVYFTLRCIKSWLKENRRCGAQIVFFFLFERPLKWMQHGHFLGERLCLRALGK
jgi:hypothetical protein